MSTAVSSKERKVVNIEITGATTDIGSEASKRMPSMYRYRYEVPVRYTLDDGTVIDSKIQGITQAKLQSKIASDIALVGSKSISAKFWQSDGGGDWIFIRSYGG